MALPGTLPPSKLFSEAAQQLKGGYRPQLPLLELALIEAMRGEVAPQPAPAFAAAAPATKARLQRRRPPLSRPLLRQALRPRRSHARRNQTAPPQSKARKASAASGADRGAQAAQPLARFSQGDPRALRPWKCPPPCAPLTISPSATEHRLRLRHQRHWRDMVAKPETLKIVTTTLSNSWGAKCCWNARWETMRPCQRRAAAQAAQHDGRTRWWNTPSANWAHR